MPAMNTNFNGATGCPEQALRAIADAGFQYIHWAQQWNKDFVYHPSEIRQIEVWLRDFGLQCLDLHGSRGYDKFWASPREHERLAGVELVKNRIEMAARLGADAAVYHIPFEGDDPAENAAMWDRFRRTLDTVEPFARLHEVRLALENCYPDNFPTIMKVFDLYGPDYMGLCYDSGHGNWIGTGLDYLEELKDRLLVTHLHDNDGTQDSHGMPFTGTVDWPRLARLLAESPSYHKPPTLEASMGEDAEQDVGEFLRTALEVGNRIARAMAQS